MAIIADTLPIGKDNVVSVGANGEPFFTPQHRADKYSVFFASQPEYSSDFSGL